MSCLKVISIIFFSLLISSYGAHAQVNLSGVAGVNVGKVLSGDGVEHHGVPPTFLADYPLVSAYDKEWDFAPESLFGVQINANFDGGLMAVAQMVGRGVNDYEPELEWAYISYELNDNWTFQAGKKRLPLFYY